MSQVKMLTAIAEDGKSIAFATEMEGKTQAALLTEIKAAGLTIGAGSLRSLVNGEKEEAAGFKVEMMSRQKANKHIKVQQSDDTDSNKTEDSADTKAVAATGGTKTLTPEQAALAAQADAQHGATAQPVKVSRAKTDWEAPGASQLPQVPKGVKAGSRMEAFFKYLCTDGGVTREEILNEFKWSPGGLAGIIHWEPKAHGYFLASAKVDGKTRYWLEYKPNAETKMPAGRKVKPEEILITVKAEPAPKAPKEPKAPKAAATNGDGTPAAKKVRVPKDAGIPAGAMASAAKVTTRVAGKKAAA